MNRTFGRLYAPDDRDRLFGYTLDTPAIGSTRRARTWRLGANVDQGETPFCVGYAWYNWFRAAPLQQRPICAKGIYTLAQLLDEWAGTEHAGTSIRAAAKVLSITGHMSDYRWATSLEAAIHHVLEHEPVVLGTRWYDGMMVPDKYGQIRVTGRTWGGHATLMYGVDLRSGVAKLKNSWGNWGLKGSCSISLDELERLFKEEGECCTATETRVVSA